MAVGDDALAAGFSLVTQSGAGGEVRNGWIEINRTRDYVAQVRALILPVWGIADGGTGAATVAAARANLGIRSGTAAPSDAVGGSSDGNIYFKIL